MNDNINPDHYKRLPVEAIEIIESAIQGAPRVEAAYLHGQVLKYVLRCWAKNGFEDLRKAKWYLDRLIESETQADLQSLKDYPFGKPSDAIPDGWRELEPKEVPSKGDKFWSDGEWHELLVDGTVEYEYFGEKYIRKIDPPKPTFAVGDRVIDIQFGSVGIVKSFKQSTGEYEIQLEGNRKYVYRWECQLSKEQPKPAFAVGDRVRVCKIGERMNGKEGSIEYISKNGLIDVAGQDDSGCFYPSELQPAETPKQDLPKPAFAVGDRVKVCAPSSSLKGRKGEVVKVLDDRLIVVIKSALTYAFCPSDLQPAEVAK